MLVFFSLVTGGNMRHHYETRCFSTVSPVSLFANYYYLTIISPSLLQIVYILNDSDELVCVIVLVSYK